MSFIGCATVHTETVIPAAPADVWSVLADASGYEEWNPVLVPLEGELREGETLKYRMTDAEGKQSEVKVEVVKMTREKELNQYGGVWGILTFDHTWSLEPVEGGTRITQHEEYRGIGVWFWDYSWVEPAYARANEALKKKVLEVIAEKRRNENARE